MSRFLSIPEESIEGLIKIKAYDIWKKRLRKGIAGTPESDWIKAKKYLQKHRWEVFWWKFRKIFKPHQQLIWFVLGKPMIRRVIVISGVGITNLVFAYFIFGIPPWVYTLKPNTVTPGTDRLHLFILELAVLFIVTIYCLITNRNSPTNRKEKYKVLVQRISIIVAMLYAVYMIFHEAPGPGLSGRIPLAGVRLSYGIFCSIVLYFYVDNVAKLVRKTLMPLWKIFKQLKEKPRLVFTSGQQLPLSINAFATKTLFLVVPLFLWLPTLLPTAWLSPRNFAIAAGIVAFVLLFIIPFYSQAIIAAATQSSLAVIDDLISKEISDREQLLHDRNSLKTLIEIRSALNNCVSSPMQMLFWPILQSLAGITALIVAIKEF